MTATQNPTVKKHISSSKYFILVSILAITSSMAAPFMYIHDSRGALGRLDVATGEATQIGLMGAVLTDIAFDGKGDLYGVSFDTFYKVNSSTAELTTISLHGINTCNALVFTPSGELLAAGAGTTNLYKINPATGAVTNLGSIGYRSSGDLAFSQGRCFLSTIDDDLVEVTFKPTVAGTRIGPIGYSDVFGLATGPDQTLFAVSGNLLLKVNIRTGQGKPIGDFSGAGFTQSFGSTFAGESAFEEPLLTLNQSKAVKLEWVGSFGGAYVVEHTSDFNDDWTQSTVLPTYQGDGIWTWSTSEHSQEKQMFYRVVIE